MISLLYFNTWTLREDLRTIFFGFEILLILIF